MNSQITAMPRHTSFPRSCVGIQTSPLLSLDMDSHAGAWEPENKPLHSMEEEASDIIALEQQAEGLIAEILGIDVKEVVGVDND